MTTLFTAACGEHVRTSGNPYNAGDADSGSHRGHVCLAQADCPSDSYCAFDFNGAGFCGVGCHDDSECSAGLVCTNIGECASPFVAIALDAANVYYVKTGARGSIERISKDSTDATVLASNLSWPLAIAIDGD
jgi:hypothetical protein